LNNNFSLVQKAFQDVSNVLPKSTLTHHSNLSWVERATRPSGIIGIQSFYPILGTDHSRFAIVHPSIDSLSACVIDDRYHQVDRTFSKTFESIGISGSGDYVVNFGVASIGSPLLEMHLELEDTDNSQELTIWQMDVNRDLGSFTVTDLRLMCNVLMDQYTFVNNVYGVSFPLTCSYEGVLPTTTERLPIGVVMPWNCEIQGAHIRLETPPGAHSDQNTMEIALVRVLGTDYETVTATNATFAWSDGYGHTHTLDAIASGAYQAQAGEYIYPIIVTPENPITDFPAQAAGLSVTLLVKQIHHGIYR
jgi:hypothetical protein